MWQLPNLLLRRDRAKDLAGNANRRRAVLLDDGEDAERIVVQAERLATAKFRSEIFVPVRKVPVVEKLSPILLRRVDRGDEQRGSHENHKLNPRHGNSIMPAGSIWQTFRIPEIRASQFDRPWEIRTNARRRSGARHGADEKRHLPILITEPDLVCTGGEIERFLLIHLEPAMAVGFDAVFDSGEFPREFRIGQQLRPASKVECRLILSRGEFDAQCRHA